MENSTFTIENTETGEYRTFRIRTMPEDSKFAPGAQIIELLSGPANRHDYRGFGFIHQAGNLPARVVVWKSRKGETEKSEYDKLAILLNRLWAKDSITERYTFHDPVPCARCGELLTVPESIKRKLGPYCARQ